MKGSVRLTDIEIENFKNVKYGSLNFENKRKDYSASILGLYGQNGSGKTALIDVMQILKDLLCGRPIPADYANYINVDSNYAHIKTKFRIKEPDSSEINIWYEYSMKAVQDESAQNVDTHDASEIHHKVQIFDEVLSYSYRSETKSERKALLIDTRASDVFGPKSKFRIFFGNDAKIRQELIVAKAMASATSRSFIFSGDLINSLRKQEESRKEDQQFLFQKNILERMIQYGNFELFVMGTSNTGLISLNAQPVSFQYHKGLKSAYGKILLPLQGPVEVDEQTFTVIEGVINNLNVVLTQIIPNLTIKLQDLGSVMLKDGRKGHSIQLMSRKNDRLIPLKYESEGIKKIISVLQLLVVVYNCSSITVAIDEFDSGIFEYLLGELLRIISEKGEGQLIFTSHNLRPLETLDSGFVAFTTTNPENRYVRISGVKANNNLRDLYYRNIVLGGQEEKLYDTTDNAEIALAFREAGENLEVKS